MDNANPFNAYFQRVDDLLPRLADGELTDAERAETVDLFRRAIFFLASHLNEQARLYPHLILDPEPAPTEADGAEGTPVDQAESVAQ